MAVLERFQNVEKEYRERSRDRIVRQVKIGERWKTNCMNSIVIFDLS